METRAYKKDGGYTLNGKKIAVMKNGNADFWMIFAVTDSTQRAQGRGNLFSGR